AMEVSGSARAQQRAGIVAPSRATNLPRARERVNSHAMTRDLARPAWPTLARARTRRSFARMPSLHPVLWTKGTLLTPQHLQAQDRYLDELLRLQIGAFTFCPWGFAQLEV